MKDNSLPKKYWVIFAVGNLLLSFALALVSSQFSGLSGWWSFLMVLLLGSIFIWGSFSMIHLERPPVWLTGLAFGAALLRLGIGVLWFFALPVAGYETEVQEAGYVMEDAYKRDTAAWRLAESGKPLLGVFTSGADKDIRGADQYGGLLFLSAVIYRYSGLSVHQPLLMVTLVALVSSITVPLAWAFSNRIFDEKTAKWAAWGVALYPEAVLLGSSQMREPFVMVLVLIAFYGLARYHKDRSWFQLIWVISALFVGLLISPPLIGILLLLLTICGLAMDNWKVIRNWRLWAVLLVGLLVSLTGIWLSWSQIAPRLGMEGYESPLVLILDWITYVARWQAHLTIRASGWVQKITRSTPDWVDLPFLMGYGIVRPLLPPAILDPGAPLWRGIAIWRAIGWTLLLPLLMYAPVRAFRYSVKKNWTVGLSFAVWVTILIATFWGGGDMWDNPRYRAAFCGLQLVLASWVVVSQLQDPDPWMRRAVVGVLLILLWFVPWFLRRFTSFEWPVQDIFKLIGLGISSAVLYMVWDWAKPFRKLNE